MPYLTPEDRAVLLVELPDLPRCPRCGKQPRRNYCRQCDEFFHECECQRTEHNGHRTY